MAVARVEGGQGAEQLLVEVLAVGQQAEIQGLDAAVADQGRQVVVRRHRDIDGFAAGQRRVQFFGGAKGAVLHTDTGLGLEILEHLGGDIVVPVVHADNRIGPFDCRRGFLGHCQ
jgi:hypothetical protein